MGVFANSGGTVIDYGTQPSTRRLGRKTDDSSYRKDAHVPYGVAHFIHTMSLWFYRSVYRTKSQTQDFPGHNI